MSKRHTDSEYESELSRVRENLLLMAGLVEQMIGEAVHSLSQRDFALANKTIEDDHRVNRFEVDTDELCLLILAKRQPLASDLRFITIAMKMVTDLERIGDLAVNVCERTLALRRHPGVVVPSTIAQMSAAAGAMVHNAIEAFVARDVDQAQGVFDADNAVDELYVLLCKEVQAQMTAAPDTVEQGMHLQAVAKFLERIGDHATNLAELVVFMVKGKDVRHIGKLN